MLKTLTTLTIVFAVTVPAMAQWQAVGDVDAEATGNLVNGTAGWTDLGWWGYDIDGTFYHRTQIVADPLGGDGNALLIDAEGGGSIKLSHDLPAITDGSEATVYFKLMIPSTDVTGQNDDMHDTAVGVSTAAAPNDGWPGKPALTVKEGEVQIDGTKIDQTIADDTWYEFWFQISKKEAAPWWWGFIRGGEYEEQTRFSVGGNEGFFNGGGVDPFTSFVLRTGGGGDYNSSFYFDELFVNTTEFSISDPNAPVEPELLAGDANGDGQVDGNDLISVEENFGATGDPGIGGDANGDGQVDGNDLISVEENFGATSTPASVPEPATVVLLGLCGATLLRTRR